MTTKIFNSSNHLPHAISNSDCSSICSDILTKTLDERDYDSKAKKTVVYEFQTFFEWCLHKFLSAERNLAFYHFTICQFVTDNAYVKI